jgi:hypothetical protein
MIIRSRARRGMTSALAMIYLVLFACLAIGFYAQVNTAVQVSANETRSRRALLAAESGLQFMRYQLSIIKIPPLTPENRILDRIHEDLVFQLGGTPNLGGREIGFASDSYIEIPAGADEYIPLEGGDRFRISITRRAGTRILLRAIGASPLDRSGAASSTLCRAGVEIEFDPNQYKTDFFQHGMISRGGVTIDPTNRIVQGIPAEHASILALGPVTIGRVGNTLPTGIAGDIIVLDGVTPTLLPPVSVGGSTAPADILANHVDHISADQVPEFPVPDIRIFRPYANELYVPGLMAYDNVLIPPNTNPSFNGPCTIRGVVYVQQPNVVTFAGQVTMTCVVVTENRGIGDLTTNRLIFTGAGGAKQPLSSLPYEPKFAGLHGLTGSFIIAPGFDVSLTGNFGAIAGDICGDRVTITGSAAATITGSAFTLTNNPLRIAGSAQITFASNPNSLHSGLKFSERYFSEPSTYREFTP